MQLRQGSHLRLGGPDEARLRSIALRCASATALARDLRLDDGMQLKGVSEYGAKALRNSSSEHSADPLKNRRMH